MSVIQKHPVTIIISWNGKELPFQCVDFDEAPRFDFVLFNYSGNDALPPVSDQYQYNALISVATEFKGRILNAAYSHFKDDNSIEYLCFMDDDIEISVSALNKLIDAAYVYALDAFQAAVHPDSYHSFRFNELKSGIEIEFVDWVEIMMPFYRKQLFDAAHEFYETNISSYGIDQYAIPFHQQILGMTKTAVIHIVSMKHLKPVTDGCKVFSNGLTARQEAELLRKQIIQQIRRKPMLNFSEDFLKYNLQIGSFRTQIRWNLLKDGIKRLINFIILFN
jgi:hypothetical protein